MQQRTNLKKPLIYGRVFEKFEIISCTFDIFLSWYTLIYLHVATDHDDSLYDDQGFTKVAKENQVYINGCTFSKALVVYGTSTLHIRLNHPINMEISENTFESSLSPQFNAENIVNLEYDGNTSLE